MGDFSRDEQSTVSIARRVMYTYDRVRHLLLGVHTSAYVKARLSDYRAYQ